MREAHFFLPAQIQGHFQSGTRLPQEYLLQFAQQGLGQGPRTLALRASHSCVYRESGLDECTALTRFPGASETPPSLCPGSEIICTAAPRCSSYLSLVANLSLRSNTKPFHGLSCRSLWVGNGFLPKSVWFSPDVHAPTMTTTAVVRELSLTNDVWFLHLHVCICHVRLHCPARVLSELPSL